MTDPHNEETPDDWLEEEWWRHESLFQPIEDNFS